MNDHPNCANPQLVDINGLSRCTSCGAEQRINPQSGNVFWMRDGRVISAPDDMRDSLKRQEERHGHASS